MLIQHIGDTRSFVDDDDEVKNEEELSNRDHAEVSQSRSQRQRGNSNPRDPFVVISKVRNFDLPQRYVQCTSYLHRHDSRAFLNDELPLELRYQDQDDEAQAILANHQYAHHLSLRRTKDDVRWCFVMLLYFDLGRLMQFQSSGRIGPKMQQQIHELVGDYVQSEDHRQLNFAQLES